MHLALRSSLAILVVIAALSQAGCETHDRRVYSTHKDKNLHSPDPWSPSTTKAADDATAALGLPPDNGAAPELAPAPPAPVAPEGSPMQPGQ